MLYKHGSPPSGLVVRWIQVAVLPQAGRCELLLSSPSAVMLRTTWQASPRLNGPIRTYDGFDATHCYEVPGALAKASSFPLEQVASAKHVRLGTNSFPSGYHTLDPSPALSTLVPARHS